MNFDKEVQIRQIIQNRYQKIEHTLCLNGYDNYWQDVLMYQDWTLLTSLSLANCHISHNNIKILSEKQWPNLRNLIVVNNQINAQCTKQLSMKQWPLLQCLDLRNNIIKDEGLSNLTKIFNKRITTLGIQKCGITNRGMKSIINYNLHLKKLHLSFNPIGNSGIKYLVKSNMIQLEFLSIDDCQIGGEGFKHLIKANWPNLTTLQLHYSTNNSRNKIQRDGWQMIHHNDWKALKRLQMYQQQAILCINCILMAKMTKIEQYCMSIQNRMLQISLFQALKNRQILLN